MARADREIAEQLGVVKIADFGLSKSLAQAEQAARSRSMLDLRQGADAEDGEDGMEGHQSDRCARFFPSGVFPGVHRLNRRASIGMWRVSRGFRVRVWPLRAGPAPGGRRGGRRGRHGGPPVGQVRMFSRQGCSPECIA